MNIVGFEDIFIFLIKVYCNGKKCLDSTLFNNMSRLSFHNTIEMNLVTIKELPANQNYRLKRPKAGL